MSMFDPEPKPSVMKSLTNEYFLAKTNSVVSSYSWLMPLKSFERCSYVCENEFSTVIAEFKLDCANLGNKQPRQGHVRKPFCPVCPNNVPNTGMHLLFSCGSVAALRLETGLQSYISQCLMNGLSLNECYRNFVNGLTTCGKPITKQEYLERGKTMNDMRHLWLSKW